MSLSIRDGMMDGGNKMKLVELTGLKRVTVTNMTIRNGMSTLGSGGCLFFLNLTGSIDIQDSHIHNCQSGKGGCVYVSGNASLVSINKIDFSIRETLYVSLRNTNIHNCKVVFGKGGGMYVDAIHTLSMYNVTFADSMATFEGGCVYSSDMTYGIIAEKVTFRNCIVQGNSSQGGCWATQSNYLFVTEATMFNCSAGGHGGCMRFGDSELASLTSVSISNCRTSSMAGGIFVDRSWNVTFDHVTITNCTAMDNSGCVLLYEIYWMKIRNTVMSSCFARNGAPCLATFHTQEFSIISIKDSTFSKCYDLGNSQAITNTYAISAHNASGVSFLDHEA
eukprot:PhF_6_TR23296/c0_g1_i1/m.32853